jgi:organic radical activating enzyme
LQGCKAKNACFAAGIKCDTEFNSGKTMDLDQIFTILNDLNSECIEITWTGGEPLDQLTENHVKFFHEKGFYQCIETSGLHPAPKGIDYITVSPKVAEHVVKKNFPEGVTELRYVRHKGQDIPKPEITAKYKFVSPHSDGFSLNGENLQHCINLCLENPDWKLSVQTHKLWNIL